MSVGGVLLGLINIAIVVVLLLIVGVIALWIFGSLLKMQLPGELRNLYLGLVALVALYMFVALIFGLPSVSVIRW